MHYRLIGFFKPHHDQVVGFMVPLFLGFGGIAVYALDPGGTVKAFTHVQDLQLLNVRYCGSEELFVAVGDPAIYAFRFGDTSVVVSTKVGLAAALREKYVEQPGNPELDAEVHQFTGDQTKMRAALHRLIEFERLRAGEQVAQTQRKYLAQRYGVPELLGE